MNAEPGARPRVPRGRRTATLVALIAGLVLLCVLVSLATSRLLVRSDEWARHDAPHGHQWLHEELDLTANEAAAIDAFEPGYREEKAALMRRFNERIEALRSLLMEEDAFSPAVLEAIHALHLVHGELQELSIRHYFEMISVLPPEKQARLRQLASEALSIPE